MKYYQVYIKRIEDREREYKNFRKLSPPVRVLFSILSFGNPYSDHTIRQFYNLRNVRTFSQLTVLVEIEIKELLFSDEKLSFKIKKEIEELKKTCTTKENLNSINKVLSCFPKNDKRDKSKTQNEIVNYGLPKEKIEVIRLLLEQNHLESQVYRFLKDEKRYIDISESKFVDLLNSEFERNFKKGHRFTQPTNLFYTAKLIQDYDRFTSI